VNRDQAHNLRTLMGNPQRGRLGRRKAVVRVVASGKGGVGKSTVTLNLGIALAAMERRVLLVDADLNMANLHVLMGVTPSATLKDVALGKKTVPEIIVRGPGDVDLLPAPSGALALVDLEKAAREMLLQQLGVLERLYDVILIDTTAGVSGQVMDFVVGSDDTIVVITPEPTAVIDAYALMKIAVARRNDLRFHVVVNQTESEQAARAAFQKLQVAAQQFLNLSLQPTGYILSDRKVSQAVQAQSPLLVEYPKTASAHCLRDIAERLLKNGPQPELPETGRPGFFGRVAQVAKELVDEMP
jgi:flagellar biosynthesis protein FlhG